MFASLVVLSLLAADVAVPFEKLPSPVQDAVHQRFGKGVKLEGAEEEKGEGKVVYEVKVKVKGQVVELALSPDGTVLSEEKEVTVAELPAAVKKAVIGAATGKITRAEQVTEGKAVTYEVVVQKADGARVEVIVAADGSVKTKLADE